MTVTCIRYGNRDVPVIDRSCWQAVHGLPYRKTYRLKPGQHWADAELAPRQWESYVQDEAGEILPVGAKIARR